MQGQVIAIDIDTVVGETAKMKAQGYRFVTMSCVELDERRLEILYHFDKDLQLKHLRLTTPKDTPVPSVSAVYLASFLVENEIQDLFGVRFQGLAVNYERTLYLEEEIKAPPFCRYTVAKAEEEAEPVPLWATKTS
jgi:ech hydrogenase subunit D